MYVSEITKLVFMISTIHFVISRIVFVMSGVEFMIMNLNSDMYILRICILDTYISLIAGK